MRSGPLTLNLAVSRSFEFVRANQDKIAIHMDGALSGDTTFTLQFSLTGVKWDSAKVGDTAITGTLTTAGTVVLPIEVMEGMLYRIVFDGVTTGTVTYYILH